MQEQLYFPKKRKISFTFLSSEELLLQCSLNFLNFGKVPDVSSGRILRQNPDKSLKSLPPCYSHLPLQLCLRFKFLQTHATSYSFSKGERRKPDRKPYHLPYGLGNPYRNLKSENSQDYAQKPQRDWAFINSASAQLGLSQIRASITTELLGVFS